MTLIKSPPFVLAVAVLMTLFASSARTASDSGVLADGIIDFAGRVSHNHWYLFGLDHRATLESLNRELRQAQQQMQKAGDEEAKRRAAGQAKAGSARLMQLVRDCPRLIRVDLTGSEPVLAGALEQALAMPGDRGALLMEVQAGGVGERFSTALGDLGMARGESTLVTVEVASRGVTYGVVGLENLPVGRTTLLLEFRRAGRPVVRLPLDVTTPTLGQLKLKVLSDDTGQPVPAMVRLMWRTDGLQRRPGNGIDFGPQFDNQGAATGVRAANLPGPLGVHFWCAPGPFAMGLAPGVWQVGARRGVEHTVVFEDATVQSEQTVEKILRPARWVDMRTNGWWSGDDHVHCRILSDQDARNLMAWVQAEDVHLANVVKMGDIYRTYFEQRGFGPDHRVVDGEYILSPGQECPRTHDQIGHTLAMNISEMVRHPDQYFLYDTVFDAVHAQGGLSGYAHVNSGLFHVHRDMSINVPKQKIDFVEILQFNRLGTELYYDFLNLGCKLTASAGSDVPWGGTIGEVRVYAYLGDQPFSADAWFQAFGRGRTFTTSGPMLEFQVDNALPGDELRIRSKRSLRVHARAWGDPSRMNPVTLEVVRHGEVIRTAKSSEQAHPVAEADFTFPAEYGCWIAARATAGDGTSAHTTPVYVVRDGLRFWKHDAVPDLISRRLASLAQVEQIVAEAQALEREGKLGTDRYRRQLARQGPALMERVAAARAIYQELQRTAEAEVTLRSAVP